MLSKKYVVLLVVITLLIASLLGGCATLGQNLEVTIFEKTVASYEAWGLKWGKQHWNEHRTPSSTNPPTVDGTFVDVLIDSNKLDFFWVHSDLKDAFKKGYRLGYQDRTADLVLGPNLTAAASMIGEKTANKFIDAIEAFEKGWAETIQIFVTLISEGSQADRQEFIAKFTANYKPKFRKTQEKIHSEQVKGSKLLYINYTNGEISGVLAIPNDDLLKTEIYTQTFQVMGDEWGRRYSTNLIKRDELIDLLRRTKTALQETTDNQTSVANRQQNNLKIIQDAFVNSYGTDADNVFKSLVKDAGYQQ